MDFTIRTVSEGIMKNVLTISAVFVAVVLAQTLAAPRALGQAAYGNIIGTVTDATGAAVPNAKVTATDIAKGVTYSAAANASGYYTLNNLTPGDYRIAVEAQGFKTFQQESVPVIVGTSSTLNAVLQVGSATEKITVTEALPLLETDRASVSTDLSAGQIQDMPILNRNFSQLQLLLPGSSKMPWQHGQTENPQGGIQINTNGQLFSGTNFMIDGMDNTDPVLGIIVVNPPIDSVQEFKGTTSNFNAEFSQAGGSVVQVATKSGTNNFHGSLFEFLRNDYFQARDPFTQQTGKLPPLRWNQFGGSLGGPIKKDKLFAFFDYQGTRQHNAGEVSARVPTAAERTGDLSDFWLGSAPIPIYDPTTGTNGAGRTQFSDPSRATPANPSGLNIIPQALIPSQTSNLLNLLPMPNLNPSNPAADNFVTSGVQIFNTNQFDIRVDHYLTDNLRYFGRYSYGGYHLETPGAFGTAGGKQFNGLSFEGISNVRNQNGIGGLSYNFGSTLLSDFRFGVTRYRVFVTAPDESQQLASQVGIPGINDPNRKDTWGLPDFNVGNNIGSSTASFQMGYQCNCPLDQEETEFQGATNWTKLRGAHTFKWGADIRRRQNKRLPSDNHRAGVYNFSSNVTADSAVGNSGLALASFLLGDPSEFHRFAQISTSQQDLQWSMYYYVEDIWHITPKLTLDYGLRWDTWFADRSLNKGQGGRYDGTDNLVRIPGVGGVSLSGGMRTDYNNFSPRLGIAYSLNPKTVIRTGYGRSYFQGTFGWTFNTLAADVYPSIVSQDITSPSLFTPVFSIATAPPAPVFPTIPSNGLLPLPQGISTGWLPTDQPMPYVDSWNLTVERSVFNNATLSVGYVGNVGRRLNYGGQRNAAYPGPGPIDPRRPLFQKFGITQGIFGKFDSGSSSYNGLQTKFTKRFSRNFSILASYTWSKTLDYGEFSPETDQYHPRIDHGPAVFDRASIFTLGHTVQLPFGRGQRWGSDANRAVDLILGGWEWTGITTVESGLPFSPAISNATLNADQGTRPDRIGDPYAGVPRDRTKWFNPAAYTAPALYTFGNAGRNSLRGPGLFTADWGLDKNFHITEKVNLQFRWEVFNALNRTNLANPKNDVGDPSAGQITDILDGTSMRNQQFGLHLTF
jgi:hypothetical protein